MYDAEVEIQAYVSGSVRTPFKPHRMWSTLSDMSRSKWGNEDNLQNSGQVHGDTFRVLSDHGHPNPITSFEAWHEVLLYGARCRKQVHYGLQASKEEGHIVAISRVGY